MYNPQIEELKVLKFWKDKKIFEKLREKNRGNKKYSFLDGPITANNPMGVHHAWGRTYKDLFQRFKAMQGYDQRYQNGFDCQGLWIEREEEKDLDFKSKDDIEKYGVLKFVERCKVRVEKFAKLITEDSIRLGQWMDWDNSYYTNTDENNLHNWFLLKEYHKKGWLYKGKDAVPWCPRCGTASSKHDIVTAGYKEVKHTALFMRFPIKGKKDEFFLIFTTTPWTVPANVAIAVNPKLTYTKVEHEGKKYWMVKSQVENVIKKDFKIIEEKLGKELIGMKYEMPYSKMPEQKKAKSPFKVVSWNLASEEEGTGIVHIAPGCGAEDYDLGKKEKFPAISPLDQAGIYLEDWKDFSGKSYTEVNKLVLKDMKNRDFIYKTEPYLHRYPHCWRCGEELVFRLVDEWYIKADKIRRKLKKENQKVKWFPEYGKKRQDDWFDVMSDWLISRKRYYGLPLPFWECEKCGHLEVIGSLEELKKKAIRGIDKLKEIHKPWIDNVILKCPKCKSEMKRVPDVGDAWLDAGIVTFSTLNYLTKKKEWEKWYPIDFICENMPGQYRGWFNALFWASVTITGKAPYKSILGYETLKDEKGKEMHKSLGNAIWAKEALEKLGADPLRLTFCLQDPTSELWFGWNSVKEPNRALNVFWNISRLVLESKQKQIKSKIENIEDEWILSKLNTTIETITKELENIHPHIATKILIDFWLNDFSRGYIQFIRNRISKKDNKAFNIIYHIYIELLKLLAPICPFITELIYQELKEKFRFKEESIHLQSWPKSNKKLIDKKLEKDFAFVKQIIEKTLAVRSESGIGIRWPLATLTITSDQKLIPELENIIMKQVNVKKIITKKSKEKKLEVKLDTKSTVELEAEGYIREIARFIQGARKKAELKKEQKISLVIACEKKIQEYTKKYESFIKERVNASKITIGEKIKKKYIHAYSKKIKKYEIKIAFDVLK